MKLLGERHAFLDAVGEDHAAAGDDHRKLRLREQIGGLIEAFIGRPARGAIFFGFGDFVIGLAIEIIARDVELRRSALAHRHVEAARRQFRHAADAWRHAPDTW